jgi:hypothetical protein
MNTVKKHTKSLLYPVKKIEWEISAKKGKNIFTYCHQTAAQYNIKSAN